MNFTDLEKSVFDKYKVVIGLEVHAQLSLKSKIFSSDPAAFGAEPNTNISVISLGHPGTLPVLNEKALGYAVKMGLACHCDISRENIFDRKNYFYPDLPKGYQITQDRTPVCKGGYVTINTENGEQRDISLHKIHLEEDAGKLIHLPEGEDTLVDFNRAGVPLIEIVTHPVLYSSAEAYQFVTEVRKLVRYLDICDGNMEQGSLRCDANISIMRKEATVLGNKVEVKNMNSIRNVQRAIDYEVKRQIEEVENGNVILSETRTFDADNGMTFGMRTKETLNDYRYFPDPDLSPVVISEEWLEKVKASMPALPGELYRKFVDTYQLPAYDATILTESKEMAQYFEAIANFTKNFKAISNWLMGPVKSLLNDGSIEHIGFIAARRMADLITLTDSGKVSFSVASQQILPEMVADRDKSALEIAESNHLIQSNHTDAIQQLVDEVLASFPEKVSAYKKGKKGLIGMFMGELMKKSKSGIDPGVANELLRRTLEE